MKLDQPWHVLEVEETFRALEASPEGLPEDEVAIRIEQFGRNEVGEEKSRSWLSLLIHQLLNPLVAILAIAAVIALVAGELLDTIVIVVVIVINAAIGFFQEYRAEAAIEALRSRAAPKSEVLRRVSGDESQVKNVETEAIVPGDLILLEAGDRVPADARIIESSSLSVDESMLTGESIPVSKTVDPIEDDLPVAERINLVYGGTIVSEGKGKAVVFGTGKNTQLGEIAALIQETEKAESPLQHQTYVLSKRLGFLAFFAGLLIFVLGFIRGFDLQTLFLFSIAMVVSAIPEGLPAVMTITLAVGVNRMARRNAIIRRLQAVDTLGATTVISTDKTGTLTTNQMTVQRVYSAGKHFEVTGSGFVPEGQFLLDGSQIDASVDEPLRLSMEIAALCNDSRLLPPGEGNGTGWTIQGDPTEGALVVAARKAGFQEEELEGEKSRIGEIPFNAQQKFMATFHQTETGETRLYLKGAPETVLNLCSHSLTQEEVVSLDSAEKEEILQASSGMAEDALRVLAVAHQEIDNQDIERIKENLQSGKGELVFTGLLGMMDPPRQEVFQAIEDCKRGGIRVIMATGDHQETGEAIAREVGILENGGRVLGGPQLDRMSDEELDGIILDTAVFARVSPAHKQRIVASLQRQNQVVAMTGDGVNDAPALKAAEIGVAMGITGTDVTKETAEMVLTDDNFASIVNAVEEGRVVFQNVRKVVQFLISTNAGEVLTILGAIWILPVGRLIFTPIQILWVNLVTDGLLDLAIALEPKEGDVMDEAPRKRETRIIDRRMLMNVLFVAIIMAIGTLWIYMREYNQGDAARAQTLAFVTISMFQVFNTFNVRSQTRSLFQLGVLSNPYLIAAILISVALLFLATTIPLLQLALNTVPLGWADWGLVTLVSSSIFVAGEIRKLIHRMWKQDRDQEG